jgi:hypothetical protein
MGSLQHDLLHWIEQHAEDLVVQFQRLVAAPSWSGAWRPPSRRAPAGRPRWPASRLAATFPSWSGMPTCRGSSSAPGTPTVAHSSGEHIRVADLLTTALEALDWCGTH